MANLTRGFDGVNRHTQYWLSASVLVFCLNEC
jgi:hypothetical protein